MATICLVIKCVRAFRPLPLFYKKTRQILKTLPPIWALVADFGRFAVMMILANNGGRFCGLFAGKKARVKVEGFACMPLFRDARTCAEHLPVKFQQGQAHQQKNNNENNDKSQ